jgi:hypothetical protein
MEKFGSEIQDGKSLIGLNIPNPQHWYYVPSKIGDSYEEVLYGVMYLAWYR